MILDIETRAARTQKRVKLAEIRKNSIEDMMNLQVSLFPSFLFPSFILSNFI